MKKTICLLMTVFLLAAITACHKIRPAEPSPASAKQPAPITSNVPEAETQTGKQDGECSETVALPKGMEEDFGELSTESGITEEMAYEGVYSYCRSAYDWSIAEEDPSKMYVEMGDESETEYQVIFHSYTGALVYFYVDKSDGTTRMTEYVPALDVESDAGSIRLYDYLNGRE